MKKKKGWAAICQRNRTFIETVRQRGTLSTFDPPSRRRYLSVDVTGEEDANLA